MTEDEHSERSFREKNWAGRIGAVFEMAFGVIILLPLLLVPGVFFDWTFHRLAGDWKDFLIGATRDGTTWAVSLGFWFVVGLIVEVIHPSAPQDKKSEEDRDDDASADMRGDAYQDASQERPDSDGQDSSQGRPAETPTADDDLATLCTDKACAKALGLSGKLTMREVQRIYRQRIAEYHPDKVAHLGPKLRAVAEMESKRLNIAYQYFQERYGQKA